MGKNFITDFSDYIGQYGWGIVNHMVGDSGCMVIVRPICSESVGVVELTERIDYALFRDYKLVYNRYGQSLSVSIVSRG